MIWTLVFVALFVVALIGLVTAVSLMARRIADAERARAAVEVEEDRVFDFLHGLGEAFSEGVCSADLHRLIVESAVRIMDAQGGALYLADRNDHAMAPAFVSKGCPPLVDVPQHILEQSLSMPIALESYVRLHAMRRGQGIIGEVWESGEDCVVTAESFLPNAGRDRAVQVGSALVGPLVYRRKCLGILAVANGPASSAFEESDLKLFRTLCEQSAFALYNEMVYLEANEKKRLDHDLAIAREIQSILLPSDPPPVPGYELSGVNIPARQVSGDYFDYLVVDEDHTGVAIADVSGKGVPASLIMAMCRSVIRSQAPGKTSAADVLRRVNRQLYPDIKEDMFISMIYLVLGGADGDVCMARAGHDPPYLYQAATGAIDTVNPKGMALGIDSGEVFDRVCGDFNFKLASGDCLLLYTDGATEALNEDGEEFGTARFVESLRVCATESAAGTIRRITEDLKDFVGNFPQHDDITLLLIRKL